VSYISRINANSFALDLQTPCFYLFVHLNLNKQPGTATSARALSQKLKSQK